MATVESLAVVGRRIGRNAGRAKRKNAKSKTGKSVRAKRSGKGANSTRSGGGSGIREARAASGAIKTMTTSLGSKRTTMKTKGAGAGTVAVAMVSGVKDAHRTVMRRSNMTMLRKKTMTARKRPKLGGSSGPGRTPHKSAGDEVHMVMPGRLNHMIATSKQS